MVKRRTVGLLAFAGAALGGSALGYLAERRVTDVGAPADDPLWAELSTPPPVETRKIISYDGTTLHVVLAGDEGAPPVVLVHGFALGWRFWHFQLRDLADRYRVVAYDQRGHGQSEPAASGDYTTTALAHDLRAVLEATAERAAVTVGHSMGGMTIMALADEFPGLVGERLAGIALVNTAASRLLYRGLRSALAGLIAAIDRLPRRLPRRLPSRAVASDLAYLLTRDLSMTRDASPALVGFVEQLLLEVPVDVMAGFGRMLATLNLDEALARLDVPALVAVGARDRVTPGRQGSSLAEALPRGRLVELPDVGHMAPLEAPDRFTALLRDHARDCFTPSEPGAA